MMRIAVIGGGPGGLLTAFFLERKSTEPLDITLFEAGSAVGGKVQTLRFEAAPVLYEAGVAELYGYGEDPLRRLVTKVLELPVVSMGGSTVVFGGHVLRSEADIEHHFGAGTVRALRAFRRRGRAERPFRAFYDGGWPTDNRHPWVKLTLMDLLAAVPDEVARRFLEVLIHSDLATEPNLTSGLYGIDNYLINESDYCQLYSIVGGLSRFVESVAARVSARVELGARVAAVGMTDCGEYRVAFEVGGRSASKDFDAVVAALPVHGLRRVQWVGRLLRTAMESHVARYDVPAHYLRITALFREPFWRGAFNESYFIHDAFGGCCVYDEGARHDTSSYGVLSWLISGSDAISMSNCNDAELIARAIDSLPEAIATPAAARERFLEGRVHRWLGSVNGLPGGKPIEGAVERHSPEPEEHRGLLVVGDYLFDSTVNGAFDSADLATNILLDRHGIVRRDLALSTPDPSKCAPDPGSSSGRVGR